MKTLQRLTRRCNAKLFSKTIETLPSDCNLPIELGGQYDGPILPIIMHGGEIASYFSDEDKVNRLIKMSIDNHSITSVYSPTCSIVPRSRKYEKALKKLSSIDSYSSYDDESTLFTYNYPEYTITQPKSKNELILYKIREFHKKNMRLAYMSFGHLTRIRLVKNIYFSQLNQFRIGDVSYQTSFNDYTKIILSKLPQSDLDYISATMPFYKMYKQWSANCIFTQEQYMEFPKSFTIDYFRKTRPIADVKNPIDQVLASVYDPSKKDSMNTNLSYLLFDDIIRLYRYFISVPSSFLHIEELFDYFKKYNNSIIRFHPIMTLNDSPNMDVFEAFYTSTYGPQSYRQYISSNVIQVQSLDTFQALSLIPLVILI
jgi:hypothetical protein